MPQAKTPKPSTVKQKKREAAQALLQSLDALALQAEAADMGMAARIITTAKEDLVHWVVTMKLHETPQDRYINHHLYDTHLSGLGVFLERIRAVKSTELRAEILGLFGMPKNLKLP